jgi:hypothetical protein
VNRYDFSVKMTDPNTTLADPTYWKRCSSCKKEIPFGAAYQRCSVSTCNSRKTGLSFCSVNCWDAHLGFANHRESSALEERAPSKAQFLREQSDQQEKTMSDTTNKRVIVRPSVDEEGSGGVAPVQLMEVDSLVVVSKVKKLIRDQSSFNTSQCAVDALTQVVVKECLRAIESAKANGRKTVMGRDF